MVMMQDHRLGMLRIQSNSDAKPSPSDDKNLKPLPRKKLAKNNVSKVFCNSWESRHRIDNLDVLLMTERTR
jgi:hypothetical protein